MPDFQHHPHVCWNLATQIQTCLFLAHPGRDADSGCHERRHQPVPVDLEPLSCERRAQQRYKSKHGLR